MILSKTDILQREKQLGHRDMASRRAYNFQLQGGVRLPFSLTDLERDPVLHRDGHREKNKAAEKQYRRIKKKLEADKKRADKKATERFLRRAKKGKKEGADSFEKAQLRSAKGEKYDALKQIAGEESATPESRMPHVADALRKIAKAEAEGPPKKRRKKKTKKKK